MQPTGIHCLTTHTQVCGSQALEPNLWAIVTLTASSDSLSPTEVSAVHVSRYQSVEMELWKGLGSFD